MTISLPTVRKKRKSEVLDPNAPEIVRKTATDFANFFSEHYDEFAMEYPILAELKQVAQTVALARWLVDEGIPVPSSLLTEPVENVETLSSTPAIGLDVNKRAGKIFYLVGGVDSCSMEAQNHYSRTVQTPNIVASALEQQPKDAPRTWAFTYAGKEYISVVLSGDFMQVPPRVGLPAGSGSAASQYSETHLWRRMRPCLRR